MNKPTYISEEMLKRFLAGELSKTEQSNFDAFLAENPFEKEAIEGMQMLTNEELEQDLEELRSKIRGKASVKVFPYRAVAASVAILLCSIALALYFVKSPDITQAVNTKKNEDTQSLVQKEETTKNTKEEVNSTKLNDAENQQVIQKKKFFPEEKTEITTKKFDEALAEQEYFETEKTMQSAVPIEENKDDTKIVETEKKIVKKEETKPDLDLHSQNKPTESLRKEIAASRTEQGQQIPAHTGKKEKKQKAKKYGSPSPQENRALNIAKEDSYQATPLQLQGQVVDAQSQTALANVKIAAKGQKKIAFSDSLGKFSLEIPFAEKYLLVLELPGYKILETEAKPSQKNVFYLKK